MGSARGGLPALGLSLPDRCRGLGAESAQHLTSPWHPGLGAGCWQRGQDAILASWGWGQWAAQLGCLAPGKGGSRLSSLLHNALVNAELFVFFIINNC